MPKSGTGLGLSVSQKIHPRRLWHARCSLPWFDCHNAGRS
jgi:hypothetical protein